MIDLRTHFPDIAAAKTEDGWGAQSVIKKWKKRRGGIYALQLEGATEKVEKARPLEPGFPRPLGQ